MDIVPVSLTGYNWLLEAHDTWGAALLGPTWDDSFADTDRHMGGGEGGLLYRNALRHQRPSPAMTTALEGNGFKAGADVHD